MPITIEATPGHAAANSFATEAQFIAYAATRLNVPAGTTVSGATIQENEKKALIEATRELTVLEYDGSRVTTTQALSAPRRWWINPDAPSVEIAEEMTQTEAYFDEDEIPQRLVDATCELALEFLKAGTTDIASAGADDNLKRKKIGPIEKEWFDRNDQDRGLARFPRVASFIQPLLSTGAGVTTLDRV